MDSENSNAKIQHVNKKSSDELLRKFAELGDEKKEARKELRLAKRRKRMMSSSGRRGGEYCESPLNNNGSGSLVEMKWLLPPAAAARRPPLLRQLGIGRSQLRARDIRNKSLFGTIEKVTFYYVGSFWGMHFLKKNLTL